jgi:hypothetical protein
MVTTPAMLARPATAMRRRLPVRDASIGAMRKTGTNIEARPPVSIATKVKKPQRLKIEKAWTSC